MQRLLIIVTLSWFILASWATTSYAQETALSLDEATVASLVDSQISGRSIAYTQPMLEIRLTNLTTRGVTLHIPQGQQLQRSEEHYANVIIGQSETITLAANETKAQTLVAYSLDANLAFPAPSTSYTPAPPTTNSDLIELLRRIEEESAQASLAAQLAVWMVQGNYSDYDDFVTQFDTDVALDQHRSLTRRLLGQSGYIPDEIASLLIGILAVSVIVGGWLLLRRNLQANFDGYRVRGHIATGVKYHIRQAQPRNKSDLFAIKEPIDAATEARCLREIEIREQIGETPPHIVSLLDSGYFAFDKTSRAKPYLVEAYIDGADLSKVLSEKKKLGTNIALEITSQLIIALSYLHERYGIIHREIQPSNILVDRQGKVWLTDFSSAIDRHQDEFQIVKRNEVNNHFWLAPEMIRWKRSLYYANGKRPIPAATLKSRQVDIFSLGVLLYQLMVGTPPFAGQREQQFFATPLLQLDGLSELDPHIAEAIRRCLDANPAARFQSIRALEAQLNLPLPSTVAQQARAELGRIVQDVAVKSS